MSVTDGGQEVAYETAVLGRLRHGYRVIQLRSLQGTRIELCYLLVRVSFGEELNLWPTSRQVLARPYVTRCFSHPPARSGRTAPPAHAMPHVFAPAASYPELHGGRAVVTLGR